MRKLLLSLLLIPGLAFAAGQNAMVSWVLPTTYVDGTLLPATDIAFTSIFYTINGAPVHVVVNAPGTSTTVHMICGSSNFNLTVTTTASAHYPTTTSKPTANVFYDTGIKCAPNTPANFTIK